MNTNDWSDVIQYTRQALSKGGGWTCTLHMHDAENILVGEGDTMEEAYAAAMAGGGKRKRRVPTWPLTGVALIVAAFAGIQASFNGDWVQIVAAVVAILTAIRLIILKR